MTLFPLARFSVLFLCQSEERFEKWIKDLMALCNSFVDLLEKTNRGGASSDEDYVCHRN